MRKKTLLAVLPYGLNDRMMLFPEYTVCRMLASNEWRVIGVTRREYGEAAQGGAYGIEVFRYAGTLRGIARVCAILLRARPDVVHVHTLRNNRVGVVAAMLAKMLGIPLAFSEAGLLHDHYLVEDRDDPLGKPIAYGNVSTSFSIRGARSYFFHWPLTHADAVVFYSKHNVPIARKLGIPQISYIPLIVDDVLHGGESTDITRRLPEGPYGLFVGQMKLRKGWDILLRAIALVDPAIVPSFVIVSSTGLETEEYASLADSLGIRKRLVFLGRVASHADMRVIFEHSSLVVVPSRYEGFGLVPLEAFAARRPVIASSVDALTDFLTDGENAVLVPPKDPDALAQAIVRVMADAPLRSRIVEGGAHLIASLASPAAARAWRDFYDGLISSSQFSTRPPVSLSR